MDDTIVKPIKDLVKVEVAPIKEELKIVRVQVAENTVRLEGHLHILDQHTKKLDDHFRILDEHSNKLDALSAEMILMRQITEATYELLQLVAEKSGVLEIKKS